MTGNSELVGTVSLQDQLAEVKREIGMRERVYPRMVADGRLSAVAAKMYLERMRSVASTLEALSEQKVRG